LELRTILYAFMNIQLLNYNNLVHNKIKITL
jgi:hypothetical protein